MTEFRFNPIRISCKDILVEENDFIVINKPSGLLSQSTYGVDSLQTQLRRWMLQEAGWPTWTPAEPQPPIKSRSKDTPFEDAVAAACSGNLQETDESDLSRLIELAETKLAVHPNFPSPANREEWGRLFRGEAKFPFAELPHRLDRGTSGALLVARNSKSLSLFGNQFHSRKVEKKYWAILEGIPQSKSGRWEDWIRKLPDEAHVEVTSADSIGAKQAIMEFQVLAEDGQRALLEIELLTGRMHQIRVQCAARGLPVWGDFQYGSKKTWAEHSSMTSFDQHSALHARWLAFRHPKDGRVIQVTAPLPELWQTKAAKLLNSPT